MPQATKIDRLVWQFDHRRHYWEVRQPLHKRIFHRIAKAARKRDLLRRRKVLTAYEHHQVLEPCCPDLGDHLISQFIGEIDPFDFRADSTRNWPDFNVLIVHERVGMFGPLVRSTVAGYSGALLAAARQFHDAGAENRKFVILIKCFLFDFD